MKINKGEMFRCIDNVFAHDNREIRFNVGKVYECVGHNCLRDNFNENLSIANEDFFKKHFCKITSTKATDKVNHPKHYTWLKEKCGVEVIDITRHLDFCLGNTLKYILRAGHKKELGMSDLEKEIEDLKKASFYLNDKIKNLTKEYAKRSMESS